MSRNFVRYLLLLSIILIITHTGFAQSKVYGDTETGSGGITILMDELQSISDATPQKKKLRKPNEFEKFRRLLNNPGSPGISSYPVNGATLSDVATTQTLHSNFQSITVSESGAVPPDCMGDVSETQIGVATNGRLKFYAKPTLCDAPLTTPVSGSSQSLSGAQFSIDLDIFFASVRDNSETTDPSVYYDRLSKRWFVVCINTVQKSNRVLIAVSNNAVITGSTSFTFYYFTHDQGTVSGGFDYQRFGDFPMVAIDNQALYVGVLVFDATNTTYEGSSIYVIKKSSVTGSGPLVFTAFRRVGNSGSGIYGPNPALNDDPNATRGYFIGVDAANYGSLDYVIVNDPGSTPTINTGTVTVPATSGPIDQVAQGSNKPLDGIDDRLLNVQMMKNKITGQFSIWTAHNIAVTSNGTASSSGNGLRNAVRWYELTPGTNTVALKQAGTLYDNATSSPLGYWMGSIAGSGQGHALTGASVASLSQTPNVAIAGRYFNQTAGQLAPPVFVTTSTATYNLETTDNQRWGDYSQTVVDPSDNMTMWTFQQYANATDRWAERAIQVKAPPPATPVSLSPIACNDTRTAVVTLTGSTNNNFSGFFDPGNDEGGPGFTDHLAVQSSGNVTVTDVQLISATEIRFAMNYAAAALGSQQTLTITNPDCQSVTFSYTLPATCDGPVTLKPITIIPNPAVGLIKLYLQTSGGQIRIIDMAGRLMYSTTASSTYVQIPVTFARGVYVVEYINGEKKDTEKLMVQ